MAIPPSTNSAATLVASDPSTVGSPTLALSAGGLLTLFDQGASGLVQVGQFGINKPVQLAIPGGWVAADSFDAGVYILDPSGSVVASDPILFSASGVIAMGYGPGGHVLVTVSVPNAETQGVVLDTSGATVAPPFVIFPSTDALGVLQVATDGTSFFVAGRGGLARIGADGSVITVTYGFPSSTQPNSSPTVSWDGTTGWYVVAHTAQPFDATGARVGSPITIPSFVLSDFVVSSHMVAYGDGLVGTAASGTTSQHKLALVRLDASGTVVATSEFGAGNSDPLFARFGSQIAVTWLGAQQLLLTVITP